MALARARWAAIFLHSQSLYICLCNAVQAIRDNRDIFEHVLNFDLWLYLTKGLFFLSWKLFSRVLCSLVSSPPLCVSTFFSDKLLTTGLAIDTNVSSANKQWMPPFFSEKAFFQIIFGIFWFFQTTHKLHRFLQILLQWRRHAKLLLVMKFSGTKAHPRLWN